MQKSVEQSEVHIEWRARSDNENYYENYQTNQETISNKRQTSRNKSKCKEKVTETDQQSAKKSKKHHKRNLYKDWLNSKSSKHKDYVQEVKGDPK